MLVNGVDSNGFELEKVGGTVPELNAFVSTQSAERNVTQLSPSAADANTVATRAGTSTDTSTTWFPGDLETSTWSSGTNGLEDTLSSSTVNGESSSATVLQSEGSKEEGKADSSSGIVSQPAIGRTGQKGEKFVLL